MSKLKNNKGFGLIETLISILLLSIVLTGGMAFYFNGNEFMGLAKHKKMALEIANSKLEDLKNFGYGSLPPAGTLVVTNIAVGGLSAVQTTTVTNQDDPVGGNPVDYKEVRVRVDWTEAGKITAPQQIDLTTFMSP